MGRDIDALNDEMKGAGWRTLPLRRRHPFDFAPGRHFATFRRMGFGMMDAQRRWWRRTMSPMSPEVSDLLKRALSLPVDERAALANTLLDTA